MLSTDFVQGEFNALAETVATATVEDAFVTACAALVEYLVERSRWPYEALAAFLVGLIQGRDGADFQLPVPFLSAFAGYAKDLAVHEEDLFPFAKVARFAWRFVEDRSGDTIDEIMNYRRPGGAA